MTQGVAVVALGTNEFPAFFTPASGCAAPLRVDTPAQCAQMIDAAHRLRLDSGMVIAVPIPAAQAADAAPLQLAQDRAIAEAVAQKVGGRDVTPFLLARVNELTHGKSLVANIALIKNNARIGAQIAASHAAIKRARLSAEIEAAKRPLSVRLPIVSTGCIFLQDVFSF
jgi:pseudouridine-5'-phosphate glycosidase